MALAAGGAEAELTVHPHTLIWTVASLGPSIALPRSLTWTGHLAALPNLVDCHHAEFDK